MIDILFIKKISIKVFIYRDFLVLYCKIYFSLQTQKKRIKIELFVIWIFKNFACMEFFIIERSISQLFGDNFSVELLWALEEKNTLYVVITLEIRKDLFYIQPDQINMAMLFWHLFLSDSSVHAI